MSSKDKITSARPGLDGLKRPDMGRDSRFMVLTLERLSGSTKGDTNEQVYRIHKKRAVIGSVVSADIRLVGDGISPIHAVIELSDDPQGSASVFDLASETGVFVNGDKSVTKVLKPGDKITIGPYSLRFSLDDLSRISIKDNVRDSGGRKLFMNPHEDFTSLLLEDEREVVEVFDYRDVDRPCVEVVMSWRSTILQVSHFVNQKQVTIGNERKSNFGIPPLLSASRYPVVMRRGDEFTLNIDSQMRGVMQTKGEVIPLDVLRTTATRGSNGYSIEFKKGDFAKITIGEIDFYFSYTAAPPRMLMTRPFERDPFFFKVFFASMLLTAVTLVALLNAKVQHNIEAEQLPDRIATILYQPEKYVRKPTPKIVQKKAAPVQEEEPKSAPTPKATTKIDIKPGAQQPKAKTHINVGEKKQVAKHKAVPQGQDEAKEGRGAKAKGPEGKRGSTKAAKGPEPQTKAMRPSPQAGKGVGGGNSQVQSIGNVDILKGATSKIQNLLGNSSAMLGKGGEKLKGFGGFTTLGNGGLALSGEGKGGGGTADSLGGLSDRGHGGGRIGTGLGAAGSGSGIAGGKTRVVIRSGGPEEAIVMGAIDAAAVEAALLEHKDEFKLCYSREINAETPKLAGRIGTSFVIGPSGRVSQAGIESTTLKNANVERCVLGIIKRIQFPIPRGGGIVQVSYPFKFSSLQ
jgi:pSer/pThr/pTyr-binding forkhead associated (FHA) protein/outer membrane biosynthesis protein TonB